MLGLDTRQATSSIINSQQPQPPKPASFLIFPSKVPGQALTGQTGVKCSS